MDRPDMLKEYTETTFRGRRGYILAKRSSIKMAINKKCTDRRRVSDGAVSNGEVATIFRICRYSAIMRGRWAASILPACILFA